MMLALELRFPHIPLEWLDQWVDFCLEQRLFAGVLEQPTKTVKPKMELTIALKMQNVLKLLEEPCGAQDPK